MINDARIGKAGVSRSDNDDNSLAAVNLNARIIRRCNSNGLFVGNGFLIGASVNREKFFRFQSLAQETAEVRRLIRSFNNERSWRNEIDHRFVSWKAPVRVERNRGHADFGQSKNDLEVL